jgi:hypothetical protein
MGYTSYVQTELARQRQSEAGRRARLRGWVRRPGRPRVYDASGR